MTRIDFHSGVDDRISYTCRLTRKARAAGSSIVIIAQDPDIAALDDALWTFSELDFLPHVRAESALAPKTPVILAKNEEQIFPHYQVLINLSGQTPSGFASFERMVEIISTDDADRTAGRERYRFYQQRGYPLTHFVVEKP